MSVRVTCPACGADLKIKDKYAGQRGVCPHCRGPLDVPAASSVTDDAGAQNSTRPPSSINDPNWLDDVSGFAGQAPDPAQPAPTAAADSSWLDGLEQEVIDEPLRSGSGASASVIKLDVDASSPGSSLERTARLRFRCPRCNGILKAPGHLAGRKARCQHCQHAVRVPGGDGDASSKSGSGASSGIGLAGPTPLPPNRPIEAPIVPPTPSRGRPGAAPTVPPLPAAPQPKLPQKRPRSLAAPAPLFDELLDLGNEVPAAGGTLPPLPRRTKSRGGSSGIPWWIWPIVGCGVVMVSLLMAATLGLRSMLVGITLIVQVGCVLCFLSSQYLLLTRGLAGTAILSFLLAPCCSIGYFWSMLTTFRHAQEWNLLRLPMIWGAFTIALFVLIPVNFMFGLGDAVTLARQRAIEARDAQERVEQEAQPPFVIEAPEGGLTRGADSGEAAHLPKGATPNQHLQEPNQHLKEMEQRLRQDFDRLTQQAYAEMDRRVEAARVRRDQAQGEARFEAGRQYQEQIRKRIELHHRMNQHRRELDQRIQEMYRSGSGQPDNRATLPAEADKP